MAENSRVLYFEGPENINVNAITIHALQHYMVAVQQRNPAYWHLTPKAEMFVAAVYLDTAAWPDIVACYEQDGTPVHDLAEFVLAQEAPADDPRPKCGPGRPRRKHVSDGGASANPGGVDPASPSVA